MIAEQRPQIREEDLKGLQIFSPLIEDTAHSSPSHRHRSRSSRGTANFSAISMLPWLLLYFFNPIVSSMRGFAGRPSHLGQGSESPRCRTFFPWEASVKRPASSPASSLRSIVQELGWFRLCRWSMDAKAEALRGLTAVGRYTVASLATYDCGPLWQDPQHHAAKMHLHFDVFKGVPHGRHPHSWSLLRARTTEGHASVRSPFMSIDRGYAGYQLFRDILDAGFLVRRSRQKTIPAFTRDRGSVL